MTMSKVYGGITAVALALAATAAVAENYNVYGGSAYDEVMRSHASVNNATAGAIDRESRARSRLMNSQADLTDNRVRVMNRTEDTEVFGRNTSNVANGIGSIGEAAKSIGDGAAALRWGFR